jgi:hypothetical protein
MMTGFSPLLIFLSEVDSSSLSIGLASSNLALGRLPVLPQDSHEIETQDDQYAR